MKAGKTLVRKPYAGKIFLGAILASFYLSAALPIPTDGLSLWLDASQPSTIHSNSDGYVTNWASAFGNVAYTNETPDRLPYYDSSAFDGKGGMVFGYLKDGVTTNYNWLTANCETI